RDRNVTGVQTCALPIYPDKFLEYFNGVIKSLPTSVGISASVNSKDFGGYVTLYPRDSSWEALQSIIPAVLSMGLLGYPLINSDRSEERRVGKECKMQGQ